MDGENEQDRPPFLLPRAGRTEGGAGRPWRLRRGQEEVGTFHELATLRRWLAEGRALPEDELSADGHSWQRLADIPQLAAALPAGARGPEVGGMTPPGGTPPARQTLPYAGTPPGGTAGLSRTLPFGTSQPSLPVAVVPLSSGGAARRTAAAASPARASGARVALPGRGVRSALRPQPAPARGRWLLLALLVAGGLLAALLEADPWRAASSTPTPRSSVGRP